MTSGVTSADRPVRSTYSVSPLPGFFGAGCGSYSSTKYGKLIVSVAAS